ncbi:MAG: alpha/beta hydrolase [Acidobacteriia bacterium]|nr:alpha/beta fold hydrolase [Methyloceanibacter sp.]MCL6492031.1 alpha/beta hydrolase [Terriglobia bacterium]
MTTAAIGPIVAEIAGEGFPVVMLHGLGGTTNMYQPQMPALASYRVIRLDLPGAGRAPLPDLPASIETITDAVRSALHGLGVVRAHFVGHSMGTLICQRLAAENPGLVASLVLFGALAEPSDAMREGLRNRARLARSGGIADIADQIIAGALSSHTREHLPAAVAFVRESVMRQNPEGYAWNCEALAKATAVDPRRIGAPAALITGDADAVSPPHVARALADAMRGAQLSIVDRCGHWAPIEASQESSRRILDFFHRVEREDSGGRRQFGR